MSAIVIMYCLQSSKGKNNQKLQIQTGKLQDDMSFITVYFE